MQKPDSGAHGLRMKKGRSESSDGLFQGRQVSQVWRPVRFSGGPFSLSPVTRR